MPPVLVQRSDPVNGCQVLEQVLQLPVSTWRYHWDPPHVRHLGPMAQDWWKAFGVGEKRPDDLLHRRQRRGHRLHPGTAPGTDRTTRRSRGSTSRESTTGTPEPCTCAHDI
ncbi:tail fiber domain-containing protein [Streptomyces sp. CB00316]|uniref:tail fiber domain-containing protein n=1 Tax=Streptomyces sp. CB00316 TaxID=1703932 RepID=UPI002D21C875|nr:tail fiber domain-containing protein [Streptomyces sp. CB00316]